MSMTLQHTLEARTKEMVQVRAEGAEFWTRLHSPSTLVAERRELRGAVATKQETLDAINDEIKVLTAQWEREAATLAAEAAERLPEPPVDDPRAMAVFYVGGLNRLMWSMVSTADFVEREVSRLEEAKGRGLYADQPTRDGNPDGQAYSGYELREERIEQSTAHLRCLRTVDAWALPEARAALDALDPNDQYQPVIETEQSVRARKAAGPGNRGAVTANPFI